MVNRQNSAKRMLSGLVGWVVLLTWAVSHAQNAPNANGLRQTMAFQSIYPNNDDTAQRIGGVHAIAQDTHGFMWFGGESALARFDGWRTRLYQPIKGDKASLIHGFIRRLFFDRSGVLWIGTERGLCRYLEVRDRFDCHMTFDGGQTLPKESTQAITLDATNTLYIGSLDAVYSISPDRRTLTKLPLSSDNSPADGIGLVVDLEVDHQGVLWVATKNNGLFMYSPVTRAAKHFYFDDTRQLVNPFNIAYNNLKSLMVDSKNRLWIGSFGGGFSVMNESRTDFQHFNQHDYGVKGFDNDVVWDIFEDSQKSIWLLVDHSGLVYFDEQRQQFTAFKHLPYDNQSIPTNQLRTIYEDSNGDLWIGNFPSGVTFHNRATREIQNYRHQPDNSSSISHSSVLSLVKGAEGAVWVGTENGLNRFDLQKRSFKRYQQSDGIGLNAKAVLTLRERTKDSLWVGTWSDGLSIFDIKKETFRYFFGDQNTAARNKNRFIWDIYPIEDQRLWVATEFNGANLIDLKSKRMQTYKPGNKDGYTLPHVFVWDVMRDYEGHYWFATQGGIAAYDKTFRSVNLNSLLGDNQDILEKELTVTLYEDHLHNIWVGTHDQGVYVINRKLNQVRHIDLAQGLPSLTISGFMEDQLGELWIATANGIARYDRVTGNIHVLKKENGLAGNHFNRHAILLNDDGYLFFGGTEGLSVFHPERVFQNVPHFDVKLTGLRVLNEPMEVKTGGILQENIISANSIELQHDDTMFSIDFAALNYRNTASTRYTYKLEGFDQSWNYARDVPTATYTNIEPGQYTFRVRASRKNLWVESDMLNVRVLSPPWYSSKAVFLYFIILLLCLGVLARLWMIKTRHQIYRNLSQIDSLTGLLNRAGLVQKIEHLYQSPSSQKNTYFIRLDLAKFKSINETYGQDVGDHILQGVASTLNNAAPENATVGRWGGDDFFIILTASSDEEAQRLAQTLRQKVTDYKYCTDETLVAVDARVGVVAADSGESTESTLAQLSNSIRQAKQAT